MQLIITLALVGLAVAYLGWRLVCFSLGLRKGECAGGCGCASKNAKTPEIKLIKPEELMLRRR